MQVKELDQGQELFRAGDRSDHAYRVRSGEFELLGGEPPMCLAIYGPGDVFGEIGLVEGRLRRYTARAASKAEVEAVTREEWVAQTLGSPAQALAYLRGFFARVRERDDQRAGLLRADAGTPEPAPPPPLVKLIPLSPAAHKALPTGELRLRRFPFRIGRLSKRPEDGDPLADLMLDDPAPHNVSRRHLSMDVVSGGLVLVSDLGSSLGTEVNGERVGGQHIQVEVTLKPGRNELLIGGAHSPFRFAVEVGDAESR